MNNWADDEDAWRSQNDPSYPGYYESHAETLDGLWSAYDKAVLENSNMWKAEWRRRIENFLSKPLDKPPADAL